MHSTIFLLALAPMALANELFKRSMLLPRQGGDAFQPGTSGYTYDCQYPCGEDECLEPSRGDTCCAEGYGCPGGNFCLTKGYCCPNGDDPATCASQNGITLPAGFKAGQTVAPVMSSSSAAPVKPSSTPVAPPSSSTPASVTPSVLASSAAAPFPTPVSTNNTATSTGTSAPGGSVVLFTGGAVRSAIGGVVAAVAVVGGAGAAFFM